MKIVFFGTPDFAATSLKHIYNQGFEIVGVVTAPDKPAGRGQKTQMSAVKIAAQHLNLPLSQPTNLKSESFQNQLKEWNPDLGVVIAFRMLPESVWNFPSLGTVNLHASLLPDYRGAAPIQHAIINGESFTGVSTFFLKHAIDTGDIIDQLKVEIPNSMNAGSLHDELMIRGSELMVKTLHKIEEFGLNTPTTPQNNKGLSNKLAPKIHREFCEIHLETNTIDAYNKIRGLSPYPGAWIQSPWGNMKIFDSEIHNNSSVKDLGFHIENRDLTLKFHDGTLRVKEIQIPGKSRMSARDFLNGLTKKK